MPQVARPAGKWGYFGFLWIGGGRIRRSHAPLIERGRGVFYHPSMAPTPTSAFVARRRALLSRLETPALLAAGEARPRNYRGNAYPFRASSHFLYFLGENIPGAALLFADGQTTLFAEPPDPDDALWSGPRPSLGDLRTLHGVDAVRPLDQLEAAVGAAGAKVATIPTQDPASAAMLARVLGRTVAMSGADRLEDGSPDAALAEAMIALRLCHDEAAIAQLRVAGAGTAEAHVIGMRATRGARGEAEVAAAIVAALRAQLLEDSFQPIVSVHGEILHNEAHDGALAPGDLLLADVGGETREGWAGDITRVWPVSGRFSPTQRDLYEAVLAAERAAIDKVKPGVRYREVHLTAARVLVERLRDLGVLRGEVDGLLERGAAAVFFPHGVGHLLGLDVHDMEDLGDRAGYAPGRTRSTRFGERYLRLDRDLAPGMAVTIEPGFYQVPAILGDEAYTRALGADLRRDVLHRYADVRGIRIEDDVLVTATGNEVLTAKAPKEVAAIEELVSGD
jgi:Xaa-Pro aminopeptidase